LLDAEENAATWMRSWGYEDARVERGGPDTGIDVRSTGAVAEVTWESGATGSRILQQLVGASDPTSEGLFCFAPGHYTPAAVEYADAHDIALFTYDPWGQVEPANLHARELDKNQPRPQSSPPELGQLHGRRWHPAGNWLAYVALICFVGPFVSLGRKELYDGPAWLDVLKFVGIWFGLWALGSVLMLTWGLRSDKGSRL
jgi:hypothetical protein